MLKKLFSLFYIVFVFIISLIAAYLIDKSFVLTLEKFIVAFTTFATLISPFIGFYHPLKFSKVIELPKMIYRVLEKIVSRKKVVFIDTSEEDREIAEKIKSCLLKKFIGCTLKPLKSYRENRVFLEKAIKEHDIIIIIYHNDNSAFIKTLKSFYRRNLALSKIILYTNKNIAEIDNSIYILGTEEKIEFTGIEIIKSIEDKLDCLRILSAMDTKMKKESTEMPKEKELDVSVESQIIKSSLEEMEANSNIETDHEPSKKTDSTFENKGIIQNSIINLGDSNKQNLVKNIVDSNFYVTTENKITKNTNENIKQMKVKLLNQRMKQLEAAHEEMEYTINAATKEQLKLQIKHLEK